MNNPHHRKFDPSLKGHLDNAGHRKLDAEQVLNFLPLKPADHVVDIGAGTGFFTLPLAHRLPKGKVHALDISPDMLASLREKIAQDGATNIEVALCGEADFPVNPGSLDGVLLFFILHEADDRPALLASAKSLLKQGGWVALIDWQAGDTATSPPGPPVEIRVTQSEASRLAVEAGFRTAAEQPLGENYYMLLLKA